MEAEQLVTAYNAINLSFKKKLVFRLGVDSGFFSEYNNMILAILYCLKNKIRFTLSSKDSNFSTIGWSEFFLPFCQENLSPFHITNNFRSHQVVTKKKEILLKVRNLLNKEYLTQNLWDSFHSSAFQNEHFNFDSLEINGNTLIASKSIVDLTWRFNAPITCTISEIIKMLQLPERYVSLHIRRGDKKKETDEISINTYIEKLLYVSNIKNVFVATDDYLVVNQLKQSYPTFNFFHLTKPEAQGYDQNKFRQLDYLTKRTELIYLFATIEILSSSMAFIGTFSSNIGMFMAMRLGPEYVYSVDYPEWRIW